MGRWPRRLVRASSALVLVGVSVVAGASAAWAESIRDLTVDVQVYADTVARHHAHLPKPVSQPVSD